MMATPGLWLRATAFAAISTFMALGLAACSSDPATPTTPTGPPSGGSGDILALETACPTSLLIGERAPCLAIARLRSGQTPVVSFEATWSSSEANVVSVDALGTVRGQSAGQTTVTATYQGRSASASVAVTAEDALRLTAIAHQGLFRPGNTVTMWLQGYYSVDSAASGQLRLQIVDQNGPIASTTPLIVAKGGDFFLLSSTFAIPQSSVQVCRTAVLEVGAVTITAPQPNAPGPWCEQVVR